MKWSQAADKRVIEAVVKAFSATDEGLRSLLSSLSNRQWERSYYWLDASGMALYLLKRLENLDLLDALPQSVRARLEQNLADNLIRSTSMFREFIELNRTFQDAGIDYCNLKGFTLSPNSCPDPALRTQLDFDFLVDGEDLAVCRELLSSRGYVLRGATNTVWEFKSESNELASIENFYKPREQRCVEIHFACAEQAPHQATRDARLDRLHWMERDGLKFPALSPVDQFIGQATHILSHLCGPSTRLAWFLEFMNHINFHLENELFWEEVVQRVAADRDAEVALGIACITAKELFGAVIPRQLEAGPLYRMPVAARLWTRHYGVRSVLADFPGTKLNLLLLEQLQPNAGTWKRARQKALMPLSRPPRILHVSRDAGLWKRIAGEVYQLRFELFRCRFHISQGLAYLRELPRWRRILRQDDLSAQTEASLRSHAVQSQ